MEKKNYSFLRNIKVRKDLPIDLFIPEENGKTVSDIEFLLNLNGISTLEQLFSADDKKEIYFYHSVYSIKNRKALEGTVELLKYLYLGERLHADSLLDTIIIKNIESFDTEKDSIERIGFTEREIEVFKNFAKNTFSLEENANVTLRNIIDALISYINSVVTLSETLKGEILPLTEIDNECTLLSPEIRNILYKVKIIKDYQNSMDYETEKSVKK